TGLREPRTIVRRLFGESLYLARVVELRGWLVDVGSGAGFPGLALKLVAPALRITLIESNHSKCAFLKEVVRECGFSAVDVVAARFEDWCAGGAPRGRGDLVTTRAVSVDTRLLQAIGTVVAENGKAAFLTTAALAEVISRKGLNWAWEPVHPVPQTSGSVILVGSHM
ncbi:MAG: 16S rRNA (guanine(527)-N(7))-methyltransferase RsmG, partial [Terriglobales bacterium]